MGVDELTKKNKPTAVPYQEPPPKSEAAELSSTMSSTLPMAAMFMRNKFIGWYVFATHECGLGVMEGAKCGRYEYHCPVSWD